MPSLLTEREGITLCIVQDKWLYVFGNAMTRGKRFRMIGSVDGASSKSFEKFMEYNFERIDLELFLEGRPVEWEPVIVTSTFNVAKLQPVDLPMFKNMGAFGHYKH